MSIGASDFPDCFQIPEGMPPKKYKIMDRELMDQVIGSYVTAAKNIASCGFDMVLVHCGHGWLLSQFLSPISNHRTDEYGGSLENRMRFPLEVLKAMHDAVGGQLNIDIRVSVGGHLDEETLDTEVEEMIAFVRAAEPYITGCNVSVCNIFHHYTTEYMCQSYYLPHMVNTEFAQRVKEAGVNVPVTATGSITTVAQAEEILAAGKADLVGMGRATLADGGAVIKAQQGREDEVRPCMRCAYCTGRLRGNRGIRCAVNPTLGREAEYPVKSRAPVSKKVIIIGGGIAGMQAAQTASERGHDVTLYEKSGHLGGMGVAAASLPDKYDMRRYLAWMIDRTMKCGAKIILNTEATSKLLKNQKADAVLIAIGAVSAAPPIPGLGGKNVFWAGDVDMGIVEVGDKVVIAGAGLTGAECAIPLARAGKHVTVIDMIPQHRFISDATEQVQMSLNRLYSELKIEKIFDAKILEITDSALKYADKDGKEHYIEADNVINALGTSVNTAEVNALYSAVNESYAIGDCNGGVKNIVHAIESSFAFAMEL